jgi:hypothetical protein
MDYALTPGSAALSDPQQPRLTLRERGARYAPNWYGGQAVPGRSHPVTAEAERRVLRRDRRRWRRILALSERMASLRHEALKNDWLALEEALHAHWMAIAIEHYNLGVEAGRKAAQQAQTDEDAASVRDPLERARALVAAIAEALDEV